MAKSFVAGWNRATKNLIAALDQELPAIEATLELSKGFEFSFRPGSPDSFESIEADMRPKVNEATAQVVAPLTEALNNAMAASWGWSDGARDIIDTGELRNSLTVTVTDGRVDIVYNSPYAGLVHYGGYISPYGNANIEKVYIPGRPWITATLSGDGPVPQFNFGEYYSNYL